MMDATSGRGAVCAVHPAQPASGTCERCGNFMCDACSAGGTRPQCERCRATTGADAFPLSRDAWSVTELWSTCWAAFSREWLMLSVGVFILLAVGGASGGLNGGLTGREDLLKHWPALVGGLVVAQVISFLVTSVFELGFVRLTLDALAGRSVDLGRLFSQLSKVGRYLLQKLLMMAMALAFMVVAAGLIGALALVFGATSLEVIRAEPERLAMPVGLGILLLVVPAYYLFLPLTFGTHELVYNEGVDVMTSLRNCYTLTHGHRLNLFGVTLLGGLVVFAGLLACCIGIVPAFAFVRLMLTGLYLTLRNGSGLETGKAPVAVK